MQRNRKSPPSPRLRRDSLRSPLTRRAKTGGKGIRTPDFQLAKLALYQLSYAPIIEEWRMSIAHFRLQARSLRCVVRTTTEQARDPPVSGSK